MLSEFLTDNRTAILALTREKTLALSGSRPSSETLEDGLPTFYEHLIDVLKRAPELSPKPPIEVLTSLSSEHGKELSRLGYTVSQVVHGYGAICQSITEMAQTKGAAIDPGEFNLFNYSLDVAIAEAVTGFEEVRREAAGRDDTLRLGCLAHELRNALASAVVANQLIGRGVVGRAGLTNAILEQSLARMQDLIDRLWGDGGLQSEPPADRRPLRLLEVVDEVDATAISQERSRGISLTVQVDPKLKINADRRHVISALENLVQNAIKFSKSGGKVTVRSREDGQSVVLEVEDECGGLPAGDTADLFKPYTQKGVNRTGFGLGLAISRRGVMLNGGDISVRDIPGKGCIFSIRLPKLSGKEVRAGSPLNGVKTNPRTSASRAVSRSAGSRSKSRQSSPR